MARRKGITEVAVFSPSNGRDPCAPERFLQSQSSPNIDWPGLVDSNPDNARYTAITPNGVASDNGSGNNDMPWGKWNQGAHGDRWGGKAVDWNRHGKANRTGE